MGLKQILIVDDDPKVLLILRATLEQVLHGYIIQTAPDGIIALQKIKHTTFDLLITDVIMPGMDGIELVKELRIINPDTAVIWITAFGCHDLLAEYAWLDVFCCLEKPIRIGKIQQATRNALKARSPRTLENK
jgi:two-component system response regulator (stage 0 sporulation protein F)